jgi:uncharacterized membrane protein YeaQ/YmgE (transglycosylase-associated protein family)
MPAFGDSLSSQQVWALVYYVESFVPPDHRLNPDQLLGEEQRMGATENIIVGIIGAVIGGFIMNSAGGPGVTGFNLYSILVAVGGAIVLIFLVRAFRRA